ncbi:heat-shock protein Hsp20 [Halobacteriales archaeon QS_5_70_17]|jgi:HSP20 family protein|nr:MAG: heat-shock protein Hsp20 [Halobacteriales archaeon QS_5_70_17]
MSRGNPFEEIERMFEEMNRGLEAFDSSLTQGVPVDVLEHDEEFVVTADLPGYDKEDIDVRLSGATLTIAAERSSGSTSQDGEYVRQERSRETVSRSLRLPDRVDESGTEANYQNGVLTVTLRKSGAGEGESIDIE